MRGRYSAKSWRADPLPRFNIIAAASLTTGIFYLSNSSKHEILTRQVLIKEAQLLVRMSDNGYDDDDGAGGGEEEYDPEQGQFDSDEPADPVDPDHPDNVDAGTPPPTFDDPDAKNGDGDIVAIGDPSQTEAAAKKKNAVVGLKEKKIPTEKRNTTPYMTKYERARVLGTRALQIRYVRATLFSTVRDV